MPIRENRTYRNIPIVLEARAEGTDPDYHVRGYASTFEPYVLYKNYDGVEIWERIDPHAFDEADMSDVIFLYNHTGMVYARIKNGTLKVSIDEHGLHVDADLSLTTQSREIYEAIESGLIDQMSFAFTIREESYDRDTHTRTIQKVDKVYDVSAVSIPANPGTDISATQARAFFDGVIEEERAERLRAEIEFRKRKSIALLNL